MHAERISMAVLLAVASFVIPARRTQGLELSSTGDSFIRAVGDNANEGTNTMLRLQASGNNRALVRFDQAAIAGAVAGGTLLSATLELFIEVNNNSGGSGREVDVDRLNTDWTETGVTWNCPSTPTRATEADFACTVEGCSGAFGLINGCSCAVVAP